MKGIIIGNGLIGGSLVELLAKKNHQLVVVDPFIEKINQDQLNIQYFKGDFEMFLDHNNSNDFDFLINTAYPGKRDKKSKQDSVNDITEAIAKAAKLNFLIFENVKFIIKQHGVVVQCASIYGVVTPKFELYENSSRITPPDYVFAKAGLIGSSKYYAKKHLGEYRFNTISFGGVYNNHEEEFVTSYGKYTYSKGMLRAEQVTSGISYLISKDNGITGLNLIVDDGFSL